METIHGFDFQAIDIDRHGNVTGGADELAAHVKGKEATGQKVTDVVFICHGFRNDENDARGLYTRFLTNFADSCRRAPLATKLAGRTFAVGGMFWPSMVFPEPNDSDGSAQSVGDTTADERARLERMKKDLDAPAAKKMDRLLANVDDAPDNHNARLEMASTLIGLVRDMKVDDTNELHAALANVTPEECARPSWPTRSRSPRLEPEAGRARFRTSGRSRSTSGRVSRSSARCSASFPSSST